MWRKHGAAGSELIDSHISHDDASLKRSRAATRQQEDVEMCPAQWSSASLVCSEQTASKVIERTAETVAAALEIE